MAGLQIINGVVVAAGAAIFAVLVYGTWAALKDGWLRQPKPQSPLIAGRFLPARSIPGPFPADPAGFPVTTSAVLTAPAMRAGSAASDAPVASAASEVPAADRKPACQRPATVKRRRGCAGSRAAISQDLRSAD